MRRSMADTFGQSGLFLKFGLQSIIFQSHSNEVLMVVQVCGKVIECGPREAQQPETAFQVLRYFPSQNVLHSH